VLGKRQERLPEIGQYNAGEKLVFWGFTLFVVVLIASGIVLWDAYFAGSFSIGLRRAGAAAHAVAGGLPSCS
jgi:formate dehydrogenase subunit gamma